MAYTSDAAQFTHPEVRVRVSRIPVGTDTATVYRNLKKWGTITRININETRHGDRTTSAEMTYKPFTIYHPLWTTKYLIFTTDQGEVVRVEIALTKQQKSVFTVESPTRDGVTFPEKIAIEGSKLDFGVLRGPEHMLILKQEGSTSRRPRLILDLKRLQLEIHFQFEYASGSGKKWRDYKLVASIDDVFKTWTHESGCIVLALAKIPWYYKLLEDAIIQSHVKHARMWSEEDAWTRQSDICARKEDIDAIHESTIQVPKWLNIVSLSRWTTFKFDFVSTPDNKSAVKLFCDALEDYNHGPADGAGLKFTRSSTSIEKSTWDLMNGPSDTASHWDSMLFDEVNLPFSVRYQLEVCISKGYICEYSITKGFLQRLAAWPTDTARQALVYVDTFRERIYEPMDIFKDIRFMKPVRPKSIPSNCIELHSATVTATGVFFHTPALEVTNRIIRKYRQYGDRFLRVRFEDDEHLGLRKLFASGSNKMINIFQRVKRTLYQGIEVAGTKYEFLAWGNSQLRDHGVYFFAATANVTAELIRAEMGEFDDRIIAKRAARMGQCFSTTRAVSLPLQQIHATQLEPDIIRNGHIFSDGVGRISRLVAEMIHHRLDIQGDCASLFQFRMGGCKGVLAVDPNLTGVTIRMRKSQSKFKSTANELEIIRHAQFWQPFLNRQLILILSCLGVPNRVFLGMMTEAMTALDAAMLDDNSAVRALRNNVDPNHMTETVSELVEAGFRQHQEPFATAVLQLWRAWSLTLLKMKAKIPIRQGAFLLGTVDETATLRGHTRDCPSGHIDRIKDDPDYLERLPEIFVQYTDPHSGKHRIVEGVCLLARNPSLQPGDIRIVRARDVSALRHHVDVVVMPQLGERDLPSMCSGGDLDGDDYIVIWDPDLIPTTWNDKPEDYDPPPPRTVNRPIVARDLIQFFYDYLQNDTLGRIAVAHLAAGDYFADGIRNPVCVELAQLHSKAVDYPKTGIPANMPRRLERIKWPHFMDNGRKRLYRSHKILGKLYDAVSTDEFQPDLDLAFDSRILNAANPTKELLQEVQKVKHEYDTTLYRLLSQYGIASEFELWTTFVMRHSRSGSDYKIHEEIGQVSTALKEQYAEALYSIAGTRDFQNLVPVAVAAYTITYYQVQLAQKIRRQPDSANQNMPLISFPWILQDTLVRIARQSGDSHVDAMQSDTVESGGVREGDPHEVRVVDGIGFVDIPDFIDLGLTTTNNCLSGHLPDPFVTSPAEEVPPHEDLVSGVALETTGSLMTAGFNQGEPARDVTENPVASAYVNEELGTGRKAVYSQETDAETYITPAQDVGQTLQGVKEALREVALHPEGDVYSFSEQLHQKYETTSDSKPELVYHAPLPVRERRFRNIHTTEPARLSSKEKTCFYWKYATRCSLTADRCDFSHRETGVDASLKEDVTCWYWHHNGKCIHADEDCKYAHHHTGVVAPAVVKNHTGRASGGYIGKQIGVVSTACDASPGKSPIKTRRQVVDIEPGYNELGNSYPDFHRRNHSQRVHREEACSLPLSSEQDKDTLHSIEMDSYRATPSIQSSTSMQNPVRSSQHYPPLSFVPPMTTESTALPSTTLTRPSNRVEPVEHKVDQAAAAATTLAVDLLIEPETDLEGTSYADPFSNSDQSIQIDELSE